MEEPKQTSAEITTMDVDGKTQFLDLPSCLVTDILLRLPLKTLVTCICVCKDWIRLFRDPSFIKLHLAASPVHILNRYPEEKRGVILFGKNKVEIFNLTYLTKIYNFPCANSCNGLLCLVDGDSYYKPSSVRIFCVCNPILGEWLSISTPVRNYPPLFSTETTMALVFSAKNNQYKLLHGFKTVEDDYGFEIYTLGGTGQWRSIDETLGCRPWHEGFYLQNFNTFLHGSLHWINEINNTEEFICCFDADTEKFRRLSLPISETESSPHLDLRLGVINGFLCAVFFDRSAAVYSRGTEVEIWAMTEYGVEKSWVRMLTFPVCIGEASIRLQLPFVLFSLNEEEIVIYDRNEGLFSYDLNRNMLRRCPTTQGKKVREIYGAAYNPSFVSLQDVAKGEEVLLSRTMQVIQ